VTDSALTESGERDSRHSDDDRSGFVGKTARFFRQMMAELRRVVTPSREEWVRMIWVVLGFVAFVTTFAALLDFGFKALWLWILGDNGE